MGSADDDSGEAAGQELRRFALALGAVLAALLLLALAGLPAAWKAGAPLGMAAVACAALGLAGLALLVRLDRRLVLLLAGQRERRRSEARDNAADALTGAMSRRAFFREGEARLALGHPARGPGAGDGRHCLLLVDLDHFKQINDAHGHDMGDAALRHVAAAGAQVAPTALFGRLGGDEFALLASGEAAGDPARLARCLLAEIGQPMHFAGRQLRLTVSVGIADAGDGRAALSELVSRADLALYESKRLGRARATRFDPDMLLEQRHRRFVERELRAALLLGELELAYQPIVRPDGRLAACEALVRWRHPVRGLIPPSDFVPVAEGSLLIDRLGAFVLRRACADMADVEGVDVAVNVSPAQFRRDDVVRAVEAALAETGLSPGRLVIEVTESAAMSATGDVLARIEAIRRLGVRLALDDFGAGHCGFANLRRLPLASIKIDRSFVARLGASEADDAIVAALGRIGQALGLSVVAEGVETPEQLVLARAAGCTLFQGFHVARPQPWQAICRDWLAAAPAPVRAA